MPLSWCRVSPLRKSPPPGIVFGRRICFVRKVSPVSEVSTAHDTKSPPCKKSRPTDNDVTTKVHCCLMVFVGVELRRYGHIMNKILRKFTEESPWSWRCTIETALQQLRLRHCLAPMSLPSVRSTACFPSRSWRAAPSIIDKLFSVGCRRKAWKRHIKTRTTRLWGHGFDRLCPCYILWQQHSTCSVHNMPWWTKQTFTWDRCSQYTQYSLYKTSENR